MDFPTNTDEQLTNTFHLTKKLVNQFESEHIDNTKN